MTKVHIDILKTEMENDLPYWLSFEGRNADKLGELRAGIRKKHRDKYLAEQRAKMSVAVRDAFDPDEERDERGRWTGGGSYSGKVHALIPEIKRLPATMLKPINQLERNGAVAQQERSGKSKEEWARSVDLSEPLNVSLFADGDLRISDGHHRQYAAEILGKSVPVRLQAINAQAEKINELIAMQSQLSE